MKNPKTLPKSKREISEEESLAFLKPELIQFWDGKKNEKDPFKIRQTYAASTWWKCKKRHSFRSSPNTLTSKEELICNFCNSIKYTYSNERRRFEELHFQNFTIRLSNQSEYNCA